MKNKETAFGYSYETNEKDNSLICGLQKYFTKEQLKKISKVNVFIAGCGGLGSNIAESLVRSGFSHLTLLDCDSVDVSNLNRQFYYPDQIGMLKTEALAQNLLRLAPELDLTLLNGRLEDPDDVFKLAVDCDILVEAFDSSQSKAIFVTGALQTGKPVISASGICGVGNTNDIVTLQMKDNLFVVGDGESDLSEFSPYAPRVRVAANKQADLVLELMLNDGNVPEYE